MVFMTLEHVKRFTFLLLLGGHMHASTKDDDVPYINYTKEIINPFIAECEKKYDLDCIGTGGRFAYNVAKINISFVAYRKGTIEEARTLEVKMIETLLTQVNSNIKIRPFLATYPFQPNDLDITVAFQKKDNSCYTDGSVVLVFLGKNNKLLYRAEDPKTGQLVGIYEEPYEEALKIVQRK